MDPPVAREMSQPIPLLSIIIPTRNRAEYLKPAIQGILNIPASDLELVIEDNSDSNQFESLIKDRFVDSRLRYHYSNLPASMSENYERAACRATGEYVCLIGDDDGINPEIIEAARWAKVSNLDALVPVNSAHYVWPDLNLPSNAIQAGELAIGPFSGRVMPLVPSEEIKKCLRSAGQGFFGLPKVYYGLVRRSTFEQVKLRTGTYFPGVSPDMAGAMAVANYVDKTCQIDYPLFLPGSSAKSNAGLSGMNRHIGRLQDQRHISSESIRNWSKLVPAFYSVQTIWAEAAVGALMATGRSDLLRDFNVPILYAELAMWHPEFIFLTGGSFFQALRITKRGACLGTVQFFLHFFYLGMLRARSLAMRARRRVRHSAHYSVTNIPNIVEAVHALSAYLVQSGMRFDRAVGL